MFEHASRLGNRTLGSADIAALPRRVFRAFNTDEVEHWWGSADTYRMTQWRAELRVGGTRVTVRHYAFAGLTAAADAHALGWERVLGWLDAYRGPGDGAAQIGF